MEREKRREKKWAGRGILEVRRVGKARAKKKKRGTRWKVGEVVERKVTQFAALMKKGLC